MIENQSVYVGRPKVFFACEATWLVWCLLCAGTLSLASCGDDSASCTTGFLCTEDRNCSEGEVCNLALDPPECQLLACSEHREVCDRDDVCTPDLICSRLYDPRQCAGASGDRCEMYDINCAEGLACRIAIPEDDRTVCRLLGMQGSACRAEEPHCDGDLICETRGVQRSETSFSIIERCFPPRVPADSPCIYSWECEVIGDFGLCLQGLCQ